MAMSLSFDWAGIWSDEVHLGRGMTMKLREASSVLRRRHVSLETQGPSLCFREDIKPLVILTLRILNWTETLSLMLDKAKRLEPHVYKLRTRFLFIIHAQSTLLRLIWR